jgi:hypothetical protein
MRINKEILQIILTAFMFLSLMYSIYNHGVAAARKECLVQMEEIDKNLSKIQAEYDIWKKYLIK